MPNTRSKDHHIIPEMHLKHFADAKGMVWTYHKKKWKNDTYFATRNQRLAQFLLRRARAWPIFRRIGRMLERRRERRHPDLREAAARRDPTKTRPRHLCVVRWDYVLADSRHDQNV